VLQRGFKKLFIEKTHKSYQLGIPLVYMLMTLWCF